MARKIPFTPASIDAIGDEHHTKTLEEIDQSNEVEQGASYPVKLINQYDINQHFLNIVEEIL